MKFLSFLGVAFCALPLLAQQPPRRVLAPCELTSATLSLTGEDTPDQGRGFFLHVMNRSLRTLAIPSTPEFGWRIETLEQKGWTFRAEGGPVRRVSSSDPHLIVANQTVSGPMLQIAPGQSQDFRFFLPAADSAIRPEGRQLTTVRLTIYWAAPAELAQSNHDVPPCALAADWTVTLQRN